MRTFIRTSVLVMVLILSAGVVFAVDKQDERKAPSKRVTSVPIEPKFTINPEKTAVLIMDYENYILQHKTASKIEKKDFRK